MGFPQKPQVEGGLETEGKKWVIAGVPLRAPLRRISTNKKDDGDNEEDGCSTTPTSNEARIPERLPCPPPPRKRRPTSRCHVSGVREFFTPPDLESVFIRHVERAN